MDRLQALLAELLPGQAKKDITVLQAKAMLAGVRPRDVAGKTRRRVAAEELAELAAVDAKIKKANAELKAMVLARGSRLMDMQGVGPVVAARILADVGDVTRFADRRSFGGGSQENGAPDVAAPAPRRAASWPARTGRAVGPRLFLVFGLADPGRSRAVSVAQATCGRTSRGERRDGGQDEVVGPRGRRRHGPSGRRRPYHPKHRSQTSSRQPMTAAPRPDVIGEQWHDLARRRAQ